MHDWPATSTGEVPSPRLAAAWARLEMAPAKRLPMWAAHWLVGGYDGPALRMLAGLSATDDPRDIHDILPDALADCGITIPDTDSAAAQVVFTDLARMHLGGHASARWILDKVWQITLRCDYADSVLSLPLGTIFVLDDEWGAGWGRTKEELKAEIRKACVNQLSWLCRDVSWYDNGGLKHPVSGTALTFLAQARC